MANELIKADDSRSEQWVLGSLLCDNENTSIGLKLVTEDDFFNPINKIIFRAIQEVFSEHNTIDILSIHRKIEGSNSLKGIDSFAHLELLQMDGRSVDVKAQVDDLKKFTAKRQLISALNSATNDLKQDSNPYKIIEKCKESFDDIEKNKPIKDYFEIPPYTLEDLQKELSQTKEGLKTGYKELDEIVRIPNEATTLIGGRPSHGKTTFMLNLLLNLIKQYPNLHFYFFSYEETRQQIAVKIINILSEWIFNECQNLIQLEGYLRGGHTSFGMVEKGKKLYQEFVESGRLRIIGDPFYIQQLPTIISSLKSKFPIGAVFIDYIQKIKNKQKFGTRQLELANTSNIILETAKACSVPMILGAQLGRDKESKNKVKLDNLREAGDLEQDANVVLGLHNSSMEAAQDEQKQLIDRKVNLTITPLKNRSGIVNKTITLEFDRPLLKIKDI